MKITKGDFKDTGINEIDIDLVVSKWNHLWMLTEWRDNEKWLITKFRKCSNLAEIKLTISYLQANRIIKRLDLSPVSMGHASEFSWRRLKDSEYLEQWREEKIRKSLIK